MLLSCSCLSFSLLWCPVPVVLCVSLLSSSVVRVLAMDARGPADLAAAVSLTQILKQMTVYCRLTMSNIYPSLPLPARAIAFPANSAALRRCACLAWILMHMTVNSVRFCDIHLFLNWHDLARRATPRRGSFLPCGAMFA